jgi:hypothetical protein
MKSSNLLPCLLLLGALGLTSLPGQTLAHTAPANVLLYVRSYSEDPIAAMNRFLGSNLFFSNPIDIQGSMMDAMDKGFEQADQALGLNVGSLSGYIKSIKGFELVLYNVELTDGFPEIDFAIRVETARADEIYDLLSGKLIEEAMGNKVSDKETEVDIMGQFSMNIGRHQDSIIFANNSSRFRETEKLLGSSMPNSLAQSESFKDALASQTVPDYCVYGNLERAMQLWGETIRDQARRFGGMRAGMGIGIAETLGFFDLAAMGWSETESSSRLSLVSKAPISFFDIMDSGKRGPDALNAMPANLLFGAAWCGNGSMLWKKGSAFLLDGNKFPMAAFVEEGIRTFQKRVGLKAEEIAAMGDGGGSIIVLPSEGTSSRVDDENVVMTLRPSPTADQADIVKRLSETLNRRRGSALEMTTVDGVTWYRMTQEEGQRKLPVAALFGGELILGMEDMVQQVLQCRQGKTPSLATYAATQGLPTQATAYMYMGMKAIMSQDNSLAAGYSLLRDGSGVAAAMTVDPDRCVIQTNRSISSVIGAFASAQGMYESARRERRAIQAELELVAKAYADYRALHKKNPISLESLGFTGDKALKYPGQGGPEKPAKPYMLIPTGDGDLSSERDIIVCVCPDTRYGRLVGMLSGASRSLSESQYQAMLKNQRGGN